MMPVKTEPTIDPALLQLKSSADSAEARNTKKSSLKAITDWKRASAWPLGQWSLYKHMTWSKVCIHLPRTYLATEGVDVRTIYKAFDVNVFVRQYYMENVDTKSVSWTNYVHSDKVVAKRHEFLGPDPCVAGYATDMNGDLHIKWWDSFLKEQWMDNGKWEVEVRWDGEKWVEKE